MGVIKEAEWSKFRKELRWPGDESRDSERKGPCPGSELREPSPSE